MKGDQRDAEGEAGFVAPWDRGDDEEGGAGRRDAVKKHLEELGGKLESMYFAFGDVDCFVIVDLPDNVSAAALSLAVNESGLIATKAIVLLTAEDMDRAGKKKVHFRGPGKKAPA